MCNYRLTYFILSLAMVIAVLLSSCVFDTNDSDPLPELDVDGMNNSLNEFQDAIDTKTTLDLQKIESEIRKNKEIGIKYIDSLIQHDKSLYEIDKSNYLFFSSEILIELNSPEMALEQCQKTGDQEGLLKSKYLAYVANCYLHLGDTSKAESNLIEAEQLSGKYGWLLGNHYEICMDSSQAIMTYQKLMEEYSKYEIVCQRRIDRIRDSLKFMNSLDYRTITENVQIGLAL